MKDVNNTQYELENQMPITGERMVSQLFNIELGKEDVFDHLHRYARAFDFIEGKDVLDIASGEGYGTFLLANHARKVIGVDISSEAVKFASVKYKRENISFLEGSADQIPLANASVDVVVSFETLEHHDKHEEMFKEVRRVLRPGGVLIMSTPDKDYYRVNISKNEYHVKELNLDEFKKLINTYFINHTMLFQRYIESSVLCVEGEAIGFKEFQGDFNHIMSNNRLQKPHYNMCIASDEPLDKTYSSIFHNYNLRPYVNPDEVSYQTASKIYQTKTFRLGQIITAPFRFLRQLTR